MKVKIGEIVTAQEVADACGVSRRTVTRKAADARALVTIAGKGYVRRRAVATVAEGPSVEKLGQTVPGLPEIDTDSVVSRSEAARLCGCDSATVWRITRRFGIGVDCYGDVLLTRKMLPRIMENIGKTTASPEEVSEMKRRAVNVRWSRKRGASSGKAGRGAGGSRSRRSRSVSR